MRTNLLHIALLLVPLSLVACGSDSVPATATKGDAFCKAATTADASGDALKALASDATPADLEKALRDAIATATAAAKKAPKDIAATIKVLNAGARQIVAILEANDFDIAKAAATDEFVKLSDDPNLTAKGDELDTYLNDKCGIAPD